MTEELREVTCAACKQVCPPTQHCKSPKCTWWKCGVCGATNSDRGWNQPPEFAGSMAAANTWAKRHGIKATFIDVGKGKQMSGMMLHGLGDCTPELNCGCIGKPPTPPPASTTTTRTEYLSAYKRADGTWAIGQPVKQRKTAERYVATALRMLWTKPTDTAILTRQVTVTETPWERIEEDG